MTARREREPRSPRAAASPRRLDSRLASIAATEVPAPPLSTARAVMESYGDGPRADDSADWHNRATRGASNARPDATTTADATVAHAVDRSETTTSAERPPAPEAVDVGTRADVPPLPKPVAACADGDSTDDPPGDGVERKPFVEFDANPFAPRAFGACRICLGTSAEGGGEMREWHKDYSYGLAKEIYPIQLGATCAGAAFGDVTTDVLARHAALVFGVRPTAAAAEKGVAALFAPASG